ncbi:FKBP-type peptidyl-prolyl cis-trans isomerase (plasmid) [Haloferacaceae archaeon DSL9]
MVKDGEVAVIHFTGRIAEGEDAGMVFDTTDVDFALEHGIYHDHRDYKPLEVRLGDNSVISGLESALSDMKNGAQRTVHLEPEEAFGSYDESAVQTIPTEMLDGEPPEEGKCVRRTDGQMGWVIETEENTATVDFNHELAGLAIELDITVLDVHGGKGDRGWEKRSGRLQRE